MRFFQISTIFWHIFRSSRPEGFLRKEVPEICNKFTGEHPCGSAISVKLKKPEEWKKQTGETHFSRSFWNYSCLWRSTLGKFCAHKPVIQNDNYKHFENRFFSLLWFFSLLHSWSHHFYDILVLWGVFKTRWKFEINQTLGMP